MLASSCTASSLLPQLIKIIKERKATDISLLMLAVLFAGLLLWIYYGILKTDWIIIISNGVSLVINVMIVFFTLKYRHK
jgi:MtN3 and saliva related transmembrane protein